MIFHGIIGRNRQESTSPSWFNIEEIDVLVDYVYHILEAKKNGAEFAKEIGIITPYRKQTEKIRRALKESRINQLHPRIDTTEIKVGTVEEFQGQERTVIMVSTVRSEREYLEVDVKHDLGFVSSAPRFNVALTRAKVCHDIIFKFKTYFECCAGPLDCRWQPEHPHPRPEELASFFELRQSQRRLAWS